jgi:hypothetical protein
MSKLSKFIQRVLNANGPAQIVSYSFWGVLVAGSLWDFCDKCIPNALIGSWGAVSALVLPVAIWGSKSSLKAVLVADMVLSMVLLSMYAFHDPHYVSTMVYNVAQDGTFQKVEGDIEHWFTVAMLVWMVMHSAYLANLVQRQQLESRRFQNGS